MQYLECLSLFLSISSLVALGIVILKIKPGFTVINAHLIKTKNSLPVLSLTMTFKGLATSYINPMIYVKSKSGLYKATLFSGSSINDNNKNIFYTETSDEIKNDKILPFRLGIFNINVFYPTEYDKKNKTYIYVTHKNGKIKKFKIPVNIR